jgi:hypothetical protein
MNEVILHEFYEENLTTDSCLFCIAQALSDLKDDVRAFWIDKVNKKIQVELVRNYLGITDLKALINRALLNAQTELAI